MLSVWLCKPFLCPDYGLISHGWCAYAVQHACHVMWINYVNSFGNFQEHLWMVIHLIKSCKPLATNCIKCDVLQIACLNFFISINSYLNGEEVFLVTFEYLSIYTWILNIACCNDQSSVHSIYLVVYWQIEQQNSPAWKYFQVIGLLSAWTTDFTDLLYSRKDPS